jgi:hypothetical protein
MEKSFRFQVSGFKFVAVASYAATGSLKSESKNSFPET